ncbi:MAG: DUF3332 domain-containing protein [Leptospirales bacterium]|nr:DUF3332 domain-containing protein [Leptospirales bacterium]
MTKKTKKRMALLLSLTVGLASFQGCIGNFGLSRTVLNWNQKASPNKWVNELIFLVLCVVQVYTITVIVDALIVNSIQFWTGSNPIAMKPGEKETQYVKQDGVKYKIEATQNRFHVVQLEGPNKGEQIDFIYNPETAIWSIGNGKETMQVAQFLNDTDVKVFKKDGSFAVVDMNSTPEEIAAAIN